MKLTYLVVEMDFFAFQDTSLFFLFALCYIKSREGKAI